MDKLKEILLSILKASWKPVLLAVWEDVRPKLEAKVADTSSKWDDTLLGYVDELVEKFLKEE